MKMKHILPLLFGALFFCSCSKELETVPETNALKEEGYTIPIEDVIASLETFMRDNGMLAQTKGSANEYIENYFTVSIPTTKADNSDGDALYAVNFKNDGGYALLSADRRIKEDIIVVTESGCISEADFDESDWLNMLSNSQDLSEDEFIELAESGTLAITDKNINAACLRYASGQMKTENLNDVKKWRVGSPCDPSGPGGGTGGSDDDSSNSSIIKYGPFIKTKWGQGNPFNLRMEGHLVGCVPVAAAQVVYHYRDTLNIEPIFADHQCDLDTIGTVYHYKTMNEGTIEAQEQISYFMLDIKNNSNMKIKNESGGIWNVEDCLNHYGFKNIHHDFAHFGGDNHDKRHLDAVVESLENQKPVIMLAFCMAWQRKWCGHAYVIDGYKKDNTGEYLHINWGWTGSQDGYYARGCFDEAQRYSIEESFDNNQDIDPEPSNFNITHYYVHYEL